MTLPIYDILRPKSQSRPIIANLPHSGLAIPTAIAQTFTPQHLGSLPNSDWHLHQLYDFLPELGITVMRANYSRYLVDLNRAPTPPLLGSFWSSPIPKHSAFQKHIYRILPTEAEVRSRIETYHHGYHRKLNQLLNRAIALYGQVTLFDLHSFYGLIDNDICLGNANGQTCSSDLLSTVKNAFSDANFDIVTNKVFTGGYITRHYGSLPEVDALQIELRYTTYLPDDQLEVDTIPRWQGPKFDHAKQQLKRAFSQLLSSLTH